MRSRNGGVVLQTRGQLGLPLLLTLVHRKVGGDGRPLLVRQPPRPARTSAWAAGRLRGNSAAVTGLEAAALSSFLCMAQPRWEHHRALAPVPFLTSHRRPSSARRACPSTQRRCAGSQSPRAARGPESTGQEEKGSQGGPGLVPTFQPHSAGALGLLWRPVAVSCCNAMLSSAACSPCLKCCIPLLSRWPAQCTFLLPIANRHLVPVPRPDPCTP